SLSTASLAIGWLVENHYRDRLRQVKLFIRRTTLLRSMSLNQRAEFIEQRGRVMRTGRRFRMILHAEDRPGFVPHAFDGLVVQVDAIDRNPGRQRGGIDRKAVVLRGDFNFAGLQILHRLVRTAMSESQFECLAAKRLSQNLMSETDAENRNPAAHQTAH